MSTHTSPVQKHNIPEIPGDVIVTINNRQLYSVASLITIYNPELIRHEAYSTPVRKNDSTPSPMSPLQEAAIQFIISTMQRYIEDITNNFTQIPDHVRVMSTGGIVWVINSSVEQSNLHIDCSIYLDAYIACLYTPEIVGGSKTMEDTQIIITNASAQSPAKSEIKFIHGRWHDSDGSIISKGGCTIAFRDNGDGTYTFATSQCSNDDAFNKQVGRDLAAERLEEGSVAKTVAVKSNVTNSDQFRHITSLFFHTMHHRKHPQYYMAAK